MLAMQYVLDRQPDLESLTRPFSPCVLEPVDPTARTRV